nr:LysM peptidoglycan-binding domain-containing protein [Natronospira proteinivora]
MREHGVPEGMVALPHVESSFTPYARSRVGASGMWQFTQGTGQRFMQVDHVVDERLDPWLSSVAAAQLLRHNYETTGSWPLALTAYNHGAAGVRRAVSVMGSDDIVTLNRQYEGRRFGFASRNFYPSFLAALDLHAEPHRYFNDLNIRSAEAPNSVKMEAYLPLSAVVEALDLAEETLRRLNPALRDPVWDGRKHIPRGYVLRLPQDHSGINGSELLAAVPEDQHFARQEPDRYHVLRRGETLSHVADRYGVGLSELVSANNLQNPHRVRVGQRLTLPGQAAAATARGAGARDGVHVLRRGESLSLVADRYDISLSELIAANDLANPHRVRQGQRLTLPGRGGGASLRQERVPADGQYRVRPGDNLSLIAQRFATSVSELNALNDFDNGDRIFPGQTIQVGQPRAEEVVETEEPEAPAEEDSQAETEVAAADPTVDDVPALEESPEAVIDEDAEPGVVATEMADAMLAETQPELAADPADYAVGSDGRVELQWGETLGHHADWLEIPTQRLRQLNELRFGQSVSAGDRLRLDFAQVSPSEYETRRHAFHQQIQAQFFQDHRIAGVEDYSVRSGDSLWVITRRFGNLPEWLLQQYNPDMDMARLRPGDTLSLPQVEDRQ